MQRVHRLRNDCSEPVIGTLVKRAVAMDAESGLVSYDWLELEMTRALNSPMVDGILLGIDSPGGEVNGSIALADLIWEGRSKKRTSEERASDLMIQAKMSDQLKKRPETPLAA